MAIEHNPTFFIWGIRVFYLIVFIAFFISTILLSKYVLNKRKDLKIKFFFELSLVLFAFALFFGFFLPYVFDWNFSSLRGIILVSLFSLLYVKVIRRKSLVYLDVLAIFSLLILAISRLGCFIEWHCYGVETNLPWGIVVNGAMPVHPTQVYLSLISFTLFILFFKLKQKKFFIKNPGNIALACLGSYSFLRLIIIEPIREGVGTTDGILRSSLLILIFLSSSLLLFVRNKKK